jgi:hypothetical protein
MIFVERSYERSLRAGVQWRKISFCNRGHKGEMAVARLPIVTPTIWQDDDEPVCVFPCFYQLSRL